MMGSIERMTRYGRVYQIVLDCEHILIRSQEEVKLHQLFVGKRIGCEQCEQGYDKLPGAAADARTSMARRGRA